MFLAKVEFHRFKNQARLTLAFMATLFLLSSLFFAQPRVKKSSV